MQRTLAEGSRPLAPALLDAAEKQLTLGLRPGAREPAREPLRGLRSFPLPKRKVSEGCPVEGIGVEALSAVEPEDLFEPRLCTKDARPGDRAAERDDWGGLLRVEEIIEARDLRPVGRLDGRRRGVLCRDARLEVKDRELGAARRGREMRDA